MNDYDSNQVDQWILKNVLDKIQDVSATTSEDAAQKVHEFLQDYAQGEKVYIVSAGLTLDIILLVELFKYLPENRNIENFAFKNLPNYLNHHHGIDLNTLLRVAGWNLSVPREKYVNVTKQNKHDALYDAEVVGLCFKKLIKTEKFTEFLKTL